MSLRDQVSKFLRKSKVIRDWRSGRNFNKNTAFPAGHYYSPIANLEEIKKQEDRIWNSNRTVKGIEFNIPAQLNLLATLENYYPELPYTTEKNPNLRYHFLNNYYSFTDGIVLYSLLRYLSPQSVVEVGSGFSSALMLDVNEIYLNETIDFTFIEPYPQRLKGLMKSVNEKTSIIESAVQEVPVSLFKKMQPGDFLFIDSSHVVKTGGDLNYILFEIFPVLQPGVYVHFHDIYYPFEYPKEWVYKGLNWNETYLLQAFLMYNPEVEIILFADYLHKFYPKSFEQMPLSYRSTGSGFWLKKKGT